MDRSPRDPGGLNHCSDQSATPGTGAWAPCPADVGARPAHAMPATRYRQINLPFVPVAVLIGDVTAIAGSYFLAAAVLERGDDVRSLAATNGAPLIAIMAWPVVFWLLGLYRRRIDLSVVAQWPRLVVGTCLTTMVVLFGSLLVPPTVAPSTSARYEVAILAWAFSIATLPLARAPIRFAQKVARRKGSYDKRTLIIGAGQVATLLAEKMLRSPDLGLVPVGFLDIDPPASAKREALGIPVHRTYSDLERLITDEQVNHVLVAFSGRGFDDAFSILERCSDHPVEVSIVPRFFEILATNPKTDDIEGVPVVFLEKPGLSRMSRAYKRGLDIVGSALALVLLSPLLLGVAIAIRLESGSPVLFRQRRIGKDGNPFTMYKFRSMVNGAEEGKAQLLDMNEGSGPMFKIHDDPRLTKLGRGIRRMSIDEMPQLVNVLLGDMSLVGPRPALPEEVGCYTDWDRKRLSVAPGITGLWQVLGRSELSFREMVSLDLNYIWSWTPWLDMSILARTIAAVINGRGAF